MKVKTVKESYFKPEPEGSTDESDALAGKDGGPTGSTSNAMKAYTQAISKLNQ